MSQKSMYYGANPIIFERAKELRKKMTEAEALLWQRLHKKQLLGLRFKSQHPIDRFIADFYCHKLKLIIEIDGEVHNYIEAIDYDEGRTSKLEEHGLKVIRFTNQQIKESLEECLALIHKVCQQRLNEPTNQSPLQGI